MIPLIILAPVALLALTRPPLWRLYAATGLGLALAITVQLTTGGAAPDTNTTYVIATPTPLMRPLLVALLLTALHLATHRAHRPAARWEYAVFTALLALVILTPSLQAWITSAHMPRRYIDYPDAILAWSAWHIRLTGLTAALIALAAAGALLRLRPTTKP